MNDTNEVTFVLLIKYSSCQYLKKTWKGTLRNTVIWKSVVILHFEKQRELITRFKLKQVYRGNDSTELWSLTILLKKQFPAGSPFEGSYLCFHKEPESLPSALLLGQINFCVHYSACLSNYWQVHDLFINLTKLQLFVTDIIIITLVLVTQ